MAVAPENWDAWLDPRLTDAKAVRAVMAPPTGLDICAFSKAVNSVKNNGPHLLEPLPSHLQTKVISRRRARWSLGGRRSRRGTIARHVSPAPRRARRPAAGPRTSRRPGVGRAHAPEGSVEAREAGSERGCGPT
jgi:hypothetical protein